MVLRALTGPRVPYPRAEVAQCTKTAAPHHSVEAQHFVEACRLVIDKNPECDAYTPWTQSSIPSCFGHAENADVATHFLMKLCGICANRDGALHVRAQPSRA